jgi:hypothetical protein
MSLLTLDRITLFFYALSEASHYASEDEDTAIRGWLSDLKESRKRKSKKTCSTSTGASELPSKRMKTSTNAALSTRSTLSGIIGVKVAEKHYGGDDEQFQPGGLSDHDEVNGDEHEVATKSPTKPLGIRASSNVRRLCFIIEHFSQHC